MTDAEALLARVPGWADRARVVADLEGGITNRNVLVEVDGERFVLRVPGRETALLGVDRAVERAAETQAAALGIAPEVVATLEPEGAIVTRFVDGRRPTRAELGSPTGVRAVAALLRTLHASPPFPRVFDPFLVCVAHRADAVAHGVTIPAEFDRAAALVARVRAAVALSPEPFRPCHNDLLTANFIDADGRLWLIDWEYAGTNDPWFDLGNFAAHHELDADGSAALLRAYADEITPRGHARLELMRLVSDLREAGWALVQHGISDLAVDFAAYAQRHLDRLLARAHRPGFEQLLYDATLGDTPDA